MCRNKYCHTCIRKHTHVYIHTHLYLNIFTNTSKYENIKYEQQDVYTAMHFVHRRVRSLLNTIELKDVDRTKATSDLENRYEHKLAEQMDRYDLLVSTHVDFHFHYFLFLFFSFS